MSSAGTPPEEGPYGHDHDRPDLGRFMEAVAEDARGYFEARREAAVLALSEAAGKATGLVLLALVSIALLAAVLFMFSLALGFWLGQLWGNTALGFLTAGGAFLVICALFYVLWRTVLRDRITLAIINATQSDEEPVQ